MGIQAVSIANSMQNLGNAKAALDRILDISSQVEQEKKSLNGVCEYTSNDSLTVRNIDFSYIDNRLVISSLNIEIEPHSLGLISGPSGVGKTTLCRLLSGQLNPDSGQILIGGKPPLPIGHVSGEGTVAVLPQEAYIFNSSIRENIALGKDDASIDQIKQAAVLAGIHNEILSMEKGYETIPGPKGNKLSVGQRRRIALARSLLAEPRLIILDEPFASLDRDNVIRLIKTLRECTRRCSVIVISHGWEEELAADLTIDLSSSPKED